MLLSSEVEWEMKTNCKIEEESCQLLFMFPPHTNALQDLWGRWDYWLKIQGKEETEFKRVEVEMWNLKLHSSHERVGDALDSIQFHLVFLIVCGC